MTLKRKGLRLPTICFLCATALAPRAVAQGSGAISPGDEDAALFLKLFGAAPPAASPEDELFLAAIDAECPPCLDEAYVRSFARPLKVGDRMKARDLEAALALIAERMSLSRMFYQSSANYERLEEGPGDDGIVEVRVTLKASEGFWWTFNFYPWDVSIGYGNLFGEGKQVQSTLGLNTQAFAYYDPSIAYGCLYGLAGASRAVRLRGGGVDPAYLYEEYAIGAELGLSACDDASVGIAFGYRAFRSPDNSFLYPDVESPSGSALSGLGLSRDFSSVASAGIRASFGSFSYQKRGGLLGKALLEIDALAAPEAGMAPIPRVSALCFLCLDAPTLLRLTLRERITYLGETAGVGIPEALWASASDLRCEGGLISGEFASVFRAGLDLDRIASIGLGFADLGIVPELFYEFAAARRESYDPRPRFQQDIGFLVKAVASTPIGRTFAFGFALGLEGESSSNITFVFEVD